MDEISNFFKAYDIRGAVAQGLNTDFASSLGRALALKYHPGRCIIGYDARLSSPVLASSIAESLAASGAWVIHVGLCGTEEIYYAAAFEDFDLGVMVTASHNPAGENGFKIVTSGAIPVDRNSGLSELREIMQKGMPLPLKTQGHTEERSFRDGYIDWLLDYSGLKSKRAVGWNKKMRIVADAGNGCAGPVLERLGEFLPGELIVLNSRPDGEFPNGVPNPLLPQMRGNISGAVRALNADLGVAFDGDFDRCFFFDRAGNVVESCYLAAMLASRLLAIYPGEKIVHDPRVYWAIQEVAARKGSECVMSKGGHSHMKKTMREQNALYGGEMSGHHFYRDFAYCDSGMLTMLLIIGMLQSEEADLAELVNEIKAAWPCSGEINFKLAEAGHILEKVWQEYAGNARHASRLDGINLEFDNWRFNLRASNTEPLVRLNVETRADDALLVEKTRELSGFISGGSTCGV